MRKIDQHTEDKIINAAIDLFSKKGLHGTTTREIAKASGLNLSLISYYFGGKEGLYFKIIEDFAKKIHDEMSRDLAEEMAVKEFTVKNFERRQKIMIEKMIDIRLKHKNMSRILDRERMDGFPVAREIFENTFVDLQNNFVAWIKQGQKAQVLDKNIDPYMYLILLKESIFGFVLNDEAGVMIMNECPRLKDQKELIINMISKIFSKGIMK